MMFRTLTATTLTAAAITCAAATASAQPAPGSGPDAAASVHATEQGIGYTITATGDGRAAVTRLEDGRFVVGPDAATITLTDTAGRTVATIPLGLPTDSGIEAIAASITDGGRTLTLTPQAAAPVRPIDEAADTVARKQHNAGVGALIGAGIGAVIGFFLGGVGALVTVPIGAGIGALIGYATP